MANSLADEIRECAAALRALETTATPGPWHYAGGVIRREDDIDLCAMDLAPPEWGEIRRPIADSVVIVAARNTLLAQIGVMEAVATWADALEEADLLANDTDPDEFNPDRAVLNSASAWCKSVREATGTKGVE